MHEHLCFVAVAPAGRMPEGDAGETTALAWLHPPEARARMRAGSAMRRAASLG